MMQVPFISVKNISKTYISNKNKLTVFSNISVDINAGEFVTILGKSGAGKSTFLRAIGGFESIDGGGNITINGEQITKPIPQATMVFQDFNQIFPWKTVYENVLFPLDIDNKNNSKELKEKVIYFLNMVGLENFHNYYPHQLSGGMKQRVAIARSLIQEPSVILMDEPFASLDADTRASLRQELLDIWYKSSNKLTILFVTHSIIEAISMATRFLILGKGDCIIDIPNNVSGGPNKLKSPEDAGFDECWAKLNELIRK